MGAEASAGVGSGARLSKNGKRLGRPPGSSKRAEGMRALIEVRYGGSAVEQAARLCMVTPKELKAAKGDMAAAQVAKAQALVALVRQAEGDRDSWVRLVVREELEALAEALPVEKAKELQRLVTGFLGRVRSATSGFGITEAMELLAKERANLMPYTDKRQPQALDIKTDQPPATFVLVPSDPGPGAGGQVLDLPSSEWAEPPSLPLNDKA